MNLGLVENRSDGDSCSLSQKWKDDFRQLKLHLMLQPEAKLCFCPRKLKKNTKICQRSHIFSVALINSMCFFLNLLCTSNQ